MGLVEIREYLVLRFDGTTVRFPVRDGDVAQARLRAALTQRPDDCVVAVTEDAYATFADAFELGRGVRASSAPDRSYVRRPTTSIHQPSVQFSLIAPQEPLEPI